MGSERESIDRRTVLGALCAGSVGAVAGCLGGDESEDDEEEEGVEPQPVSVDSDADWLTASITDVTTEEDVRIADANRPTMLHTFATGCAACQSQHRQFGIAYDRIGDDVTILDLTIDPDADPEDIREYAVEDGYEWRFGISTPDLIGSLVDSFGSDVRTSAASPVVLVCSDDEVYTLDKVVYADEFESVLEEVC
ncbi:hypothetical protein [Halopiger goleimassiliensis]|uniref:hypothetical protein n=1 Tax=Halopiger goleimassiliensis TaxID=1293048 RepID=UPI000677E46B|nr:hypothetical protein [Halopiger goleimassiliensis]